VMNSKSIPPKKDSMVSKPRLGGSRLRRWMIRIARWIVAVGLFAALALGIYTCWFFNRSQPSALHQELMPGVNYERDVRVFPRPMVIHVVTIDLTRHGVSFAVDPPDLAEGHMLRAKTTSQFLVENGCQVAINGGFFKLLKRGWGAEFPMTGDPVDVVSLAAFKGKIYSPPLRYYDTLFISAKNELSFGKPIGPIFNAVSGSQIIVENGQNIAHPGPPINPMTGAGLDQARTRLILVVVDGKQPGYSEGATPFELATLLAQHGATDGMFFDGGGSSTLAVQGADGKPWLLNTPMNMGIVGLERPVGNHFGVRIAQYCKEHLGGFSQNGASHDN
jgi:hypothetical protein